MTRINKSQISWRKLVDLAWAHIIGDEYVELQDKRRHAHRESGIMGTHAMQGDPS